MPYRHLLSQQVIKESFESYQFPLQAIDDNNNTWSIDSLSDDIFFVQLKCKSPVNELVYNSVVTAQELSDKHFHVLHH